MESGERRHKSKRRQGAWSASHLRILRKHVQPLTWWSKMSLGTVHNHERMIRGRTSNSRGIQDLQIKVTLQRTRLNCSIKTLKWERIAQGRIRCPAIKQSRLSLIIRSGLNSLPPSRKAVWNPLLKKSETRGPLKYQKGPKPYFPIIRKSTWTSRIRHWDNRKCCRPKLITSFKSVRHSRIRSQLLSRYKGRMKTP